MSILGHAKSKRGQSIVEFTLAAPLFFLAFYAIIEFSHVFYVRTTLQHALDEAARYMSTGQGQNPADPSARLTAIQARFCQNLIATGVTCPTINATNNGGGPEEIVTVTATATKQFFTGLFAWLAPDGMQMTVSTVYQNEPFVTTDINAQ
jgi:Flp pilus assembly protein TadG